MQRDHENGAVAVEFALLLLPLVMFLLGITEFGYYLYRYQVMTNASREGARYGVINPTGDIEGVVKKYLENSPGLGNATVDPPEVVEEDLLKVTVRIPFTFLVLPNTGLPDLVRWSTMRREP